MRLSVEGRVARSDEGVLSVVIDAPPMNLIGPELVRDLVTLLSELESGQDIRVVVPESADPGYFVPHVDLTKIAEYTAEAAGADGWPARTRSRPVRRPCSQGLQTRGPLERELGDRIGSL